MTPLSLSVPACAVALLLCACQPTVPTQPASPPPATTAVTRAVAPPSVTPAPPTDLDDATAGLERGGTAFAYVSAEPWLHGLRAEAAGVAGWLQVWPGLDPGDRAMLTTAVNVLGRSLWAGGLDRWSGTGYSAVELARDTSRHTLVLRRRGDPGALWRAAGVEPHELAALRIFPTNTVLALHGDLHLRELWEELLRQLAACGVPEIEAGAAEFPKRFAAATGLSWDLVTASLLGEAGLAMAFTPTNRATTGEAPVGVAVPELLVTLRVGDDTLEKFLVDELKKVPVGRFRQIDDDGTPVTILGLPLPPPLPGPIAVAVARKNDQLLLGSAGLVRQAARVIGGREPGLGANAEFKSLAAHLPERGNQLVFLSRQASQSVTQVLARVLESNGSPALARVLVRTFGSPQAVQLAGVGRVEPGGWSLTTAGTMRPGQEFALAPVALTAIAGGWLTPILEEARARAQAVTAVGQARDVARAMIEWAQEHDGSFPAAAGWCDRLRSVVRDASVLRDPAAQGSPGCALACNTAVAGRKRSEVAPDVVLVFEADTGWNRHGGREWLPARPRHREGLVIGFADGSVRQVPVARAGSLRWQP